MSGLYSAPIRLSLADPMMDNTVDIRLNLSLTEEKETCFAVPIDILNKSAITDGHELTLVRRLISHRSNNFEALKNMLTSLLQPVKGLSIWRIFEDRFCIRFNHRLDKQRALEGRPWTFDKNLLILEPLAVNKDPKNMHLDWCPFTIFVHNLPLHYHTSNMAEFIGNKVGKFVDHDLHEQGFAWTSTLKLRVAMNVYKPLKRALRLMLSPEEDTLITFTYARLPNFYYLCGVICYIAKFCPLRYNDDFVDPEDNLPFGPWIRANHQPRFNNLMPGTARQAYNFRDQPQFSEFRSPASYRLSGKSD
ncbi:UNVERIFIED_CONTAM: hypothetical protein Slati_2711800 [Sesamum latifolium]|uniref:DUF4283 domain-containing protein n=1 Tax=Sesamum latifolium TaxID=2727402 RepID=A0AAW2VY10_9LAMI